MAQTTYNTLLSFGIEGQLADIAPAIIESRVNAEASLEIGFGKAVKADGATTDGALVVGAYTETIDGIALHSHSYDRVNELGTVGIKPKVKVSVLRKGRFVGQLATGIAGYVGSRAYYQTSTKTWRFVPVVNDTIDCSKQVVCRTAAPPGGLAVFEVDFTNS